MDSDMAMITATRGRASFFLPRLPVLPERVVDKDGSDLKATDKGKRNMKMCAIVENLHLSRATIKISLHWVSDQSVLDQPSQRRYQAVAGCLS